MRCSPSARSACCRSIRTGASASAPEAHIEEAKRLGYRAIVFFGHPDYYPRVGFRRAEEFGITTASGKNIDALMAMPL